ncbi:MAG: hypothetical protein SGPRY_005227, partial [Prymnesium sp.]
SPLLVVSDLAASLNARFLLPPEEGGGLLLHQLDGLQDPERPWAPCREGGQGWEGCSSPRVQERRMRVSGSMVHSGLGRSYKAIPLFSFDSGVVLRPETARVYCAYGIDGGIDDGTNRPKLCAAPQIEQGECLPGCGEPPDWCDPHHLSRGGWPGYKCGFMYG